MSRFAVLISSLIAFAPLGYAQVRFSGEGGLSPSKTQTSANQRFSVIAELKAAPVLAQSSASGRFSIAANLAVPKSIAATCGPETETIFKNGFEN